MKFVKEVFSDNGVGSFSRCGAGFLLFSVITWITYLVFKTKTMPDLGGPAMFLTGGIGVLYGTNRASQIISAWRGNSTDGPASK
jgi:hypothetical protein